MVSSILAAMPFKFFPKDVIEGSADKPGDKFTAEVMGGTRTFEVMAENFTRDCFFATIVED